MLPGKRHRNDITNAGVPVPAHGRHTTMHPALSVIFFTTLSGAGYGLLAWLGVSIALLNLRGQVLPALAGVQLAALVPGQVLKKIGLTTTLELLGKSFRPLRPF